MIQRKTKQVKRTKAGSKLYATQPSCMDSCLRGNDVAWGGNDGVAGLQGERVYGENSCHIVNKRYYFYSCLGNTYAGYSMFSLYF